MLIQLLDLPVPVRKGLPLYLAQVHRPIFALWVFSLYLELVQKLLDVLLDDWLNNHLLRWQFWLRYLLVFV